MQSAISARCRRGALAANLGVCAGGGAAWRGRADWEGAGLGEPSGVEAVLAGEDGAWPAASARPA